MRLLIVGIVVPFLFACGENGEGATAPTTTPTAESTPAPELAEFLPTICCQGNRVGADTYAVPNYVQPPLAVSVPTGWRVINEESGRLFALVQGKNDIGQASRWLTILPAGGSTEEDVVKSLRDMKQLDFAQQSAATVLGRDATRLDATALPNPAEEGSAAAGIAPGTQALSGLTPFVAPGFAMTTSTAEARMRFLIVGAESGTLVLHMEAPPDEFRAFVAEANQVVETLELVD